MYKQFKNLKVKEVSKLFFSTYLFSTLKNIVFQLNLEKDIVHGVFFINL